MKTAYKFRMYPTTQQIAQLDLTLEVCRNLWNTALADRRAAYKEEGVSRSYAAHCRMLATERRDGHFKGIYGHVGQEVLHRLDKAFSNFFRRVREGAKKKGYPRFKGKGQYKSFTYPDSETGYKLEGNRLTVCV
jgi:putative transposase